MATITVKELAETLESNGREVRKFLRAVTPAEDQPGKGGRWQIEKREVRTLAKKFTAWRDEHTRADDAVEDASEDATAEELEDSNA